MDIINKQLLQTRPIDEIDEYDNVASSMECTGLIPTPPTNEAQAESYTDLYTIPKPEKEQGHSQQR